MPSAPARPSPSATKRGRAPQRHSGDIPSGANEGSQQKQQRKKRARGRGMSGAADAVVLRGCSSSVEADDSSSVLSE